MFACFGRKKKKSSKKESVVDSETFTESGEGEEFKSSEDALNTKTKKESPEIQLPWTEMGCPPVELSQMEFLHAAVLEGNAKTLISLLENNADVNQLDDKGLTPLHNAAMLCHPNIVKILLENQADVNVLTGQGESALELYYRGPGKEDALNGYVCRRTDHKYSSCGVNIQLLHAGYVPQEPGDFMSPAHFGNEWNRQLARWKKSFESLQTLYPESDDLYKACNIVLGAINKATSDLLSPDEATETTLDNAESFRNMVCDNLLQGVVPSDAIERLREGMMSYEEYEAYVSGKKVKSAKSIIDHSMNSGSVDGGVLQITGAEMAEGGSVE